MRLVVVSAGLSVPSSTRLLADRLAAAAGRHTAVRGGAADVRVIELRDLAVDIAHNLTSGFPGPALGDALDAVTGADGLVVVTPVFSASYSGLFKSFFDVLGAQDGDALAGKPVLIAATGGSARHSLVLDHALRPLFAYLRAVVVPTGVYAASEDWGAEGLPERIERAAGELAGLMAVLSAPAPRGAAAATEPGGAGSGSVAAAAEVTVAEAAGAGAPPRVVAPPRVAAAAGEETGGSSADGSRTDGSRTDAAAAGGAAGDGLAAGGVRVGGFEVVPFEEQLAALRS